MQIDGRTLSPKKVSEIIGVSPATVRRWADAGFIPSQRLPSGYRRFELRDVVRLAAEIAAGSANG